MVELWRSSERRVAVVMLLNVRASDGDGQGRLSKDRSVIEQRRPLTFRANVRRKHQFRAFVR
jgi:hypothetical protein